MKPNPTINKVTILGNLCFAPDFVDFGNGKSVCNLHVATDEYYTDGKGNDQKHTEYHKCVVWDKKAENCLKYTDKGYRVLIEGHLKTRRWEDKDGNKHSEKEIQIDYINFIDKKQNLNVAV